MKTQFAESTTITAAVGTRCRFVINTQEVNEYPFIAYNLREVQQITKDNRREYELVIFVMADNVKELLDLYEDCKTVMDEETTDFYSEFTGSGYPEPLDEIDDIYIVDINYKVEQ